MLELTLASLIAAMVGLSTQTQMQDRHYLDDTFVWSWSTLIACGVGQAVHWLSSYDRARKASLRMGTAPPKLWAYWYADWPSTLALFLTVSIGYFFIPQIGVAFPQFGRAIGVIGEHGEMLGLNMLSAFLWGSFGAMISDYAGNRLQKLVE